MKCRGLRRRDAETESTLVVSANDIFCVVICECAICGTAIAMRVIAVYIRLLMSLVCSIFAILRIVTVVSYGNDFRYRSIVNSNNVTHSVFIVI